MPRRVRSAAAAVRPDAAGEASPKPRRRRRLMRLIVPLLATIVAIPLLLTLLYTVVPPVSTLMIADWLRGRPVQRIWTPIENIAPAVIDAVVVAEDSRFCEHHGVDWKAVGSVLSAIDSGDRPRGASTIPMQTTKNLFLWPSRSYVRKSFEVPLAYLTDLIWSKRRMLEIYLNIVEWGEGIYGIGAAARQYFNKTPDRISAREAALLAAALPNPTVRDPARPTRGYAALARTIQARARGAGPYVACVTATLRN